MNSDWLDIELLEDYLDGKLDARAMHKIEKQALEDPFVAQALAGLSESPKRSKESVSLLQKQLYERIAQQQVQKKDTVFTWQRLSVAAAAAVMFTSVSILFFMRDSNNREQQAKGQPKKVEVNIAPLNTDSLKNESYAANVPANSSDAITEIQPAPENIRNRKSSPVQPLAAEGVVTATADSTAVKNTAPESAQPVVAARVLTALAPAVSSPIGGWAKFDSYLNDNNKLIPEAGKTGKFVELSFQIDSDGTPSEFKVMKSAEKEFDEEAIRLIKEGPKWEVPKPADSRVSYSVAF
ncbi:energy transducer TonB [Pedobacter sp. AW31-3R]|uniref:energy transducer TonB n=1 Tax=Pedobacter sp. AW31-3R TaxID=3445781 RepID=UPI003F9F08CE